MPQSQKLVEAKKAKFDEFYTQYEDIQREINAYVEYDPNVFRDKVVLLPCDDPEWSNFTRFFAQNFVSLGLKKLISTSFAVESKRDKYYQVSLFEEQSPIFDVKKTRTHGKIFVLERNSDNYVDIENLQWKYLKGDGDFRSKEVTKLRDEADIIVTNPPFSLYREFISWVFEKEKKFLVIANKGSVTYKEVFPLIMNNKMWSGKTEWSGGMWFETKGENYDMIVDGVKMKNTPSAWFTNLEHGKRHSELELMTMQDNIKYSKYAQIRNEGYEKYDNYDAIEVPYTSSIPKDFRGVMGLPATFLEKYNPEQFEILGCTQRGCPDLVPDTKKYNDYWEVKQNGQKTGSSGNKTNENPNLERNDGKHNYFVNKDGHVVQSVASRIFIRFKEQK